MKRSSRVTLTIVAAVGLAGCGRRRMDPCEPSYFDERACQDAVAFGGYYWRGTWFPVTYSNPYPFYYDSYRTYVSRGGRIYTAPANSYSHPATDAGKQFGKGSGSGTSSGGSSPGSSSVTRGGFGSTGAGHAAGT
jgi:hypothetical protein